VPSVAPTAGGTLEDSTGLLNLFGDPTRLRLLALLADEELSVAEVVKVTGLTQSRVSTHLGRLLKAGLLRDRKVGSSTFYRVHPAMPRAAADLWDHLGPTLDDPALREDAERRDALLRARDEGTWPAAIAGEMERHYSPGRTWQAMVHGLAALLELGDVLDVGCGDGWSASLFAPRSRSYVGVDRSERVLEAAERRGPAGARFVHADMERLPFEADTFDTALLFHVLPHAADPAVALTEAARVLRPGGRVVITTLGAHDHLDRTAGYGHGHPGFAPGALQALLTAAGLEPVQCAVTSRERKPPHFEVVTALARKPSGSRKKSS
tara:strand:+ start:3433 stop:4401 length:969 start_codon:yes stop_codon:yes gene_type:complete